jgi:mannose-1-phosphate guanylyltransferase
MKIYPVILAGGFGKRLAPLSTPQKPKQFHDLLGLGETLLQSTVKRALMFADPEYVITVGNYMHEEHFLTQLSQINSDLIPSIIYEDEPKNTAHAVSTALSDISLSNAIDNIDDAILLIMPADHFIQGNFYDDAEKAFELAKKGKIVTFGIMPEYPSTNYGYLIGNKFVEKPDYNTATNLIRQGALWNSGIFIATIKTLKEEFAKHAADLSNNLSFDIAVMEKTNKMEVVRASFNWDDLGSWENLEKYVGGFKMKLAS